MSTSICFFNNKGGVGKTTLTCNVASYLALKHGKKVLLIDADPQCNATQYILSQETYEEILEEKKHHTIMDIINPIKGGGATINLDVQPIPGSDNRFGIDILAGHPRFSLFEDKLSKSWLDMNNDVGSLRITNWCYRLSNHFKDNYDVIIYDVGPSLGAINRTILIGCDFFITPMGCDTFSMMGVSNISEWLSAWVNLYSMNYKYISTNEEELVNQHHNDILNDLGSQCRFLGYTVQLYIPTRSTKKGIRPTKAFEAILEKIPNKVIGELSPFVPEKLSLSNLNLGQVPHLFSLVPMAQAANAPIFMLDSKDGLNGSQYSQQRAYISILKEIAANLLRNVEVGTQYEAL
ncbi:ParA family protein [Tumebacillus lipolyticus]|uniref:ParA family protein n=1 Tax=Tumebacillus lipolyticus TaxID=1280370 RepID=A0ABW4ZXB4_9BACL